jgi:hypothetical protein
MDTINNKKSYTQKDTDLKIVSKWTTDTQIKEMLRQWEMLCQELVTFQCLTQAHQMSKKRIETAIEMTKLVPAFKWTASKTISTIPKLPGNLLLKKALQRITKSKGEQRMV